MFKLLLNIDISFHFCNLLVITNCWKKQNAQQYGAVWTTGNHLPVVYTLMES